MEIVASQDAWVTILLSGLRPALEPNGLDFALGGSWSQTSTDGHQS